MSSGSIDLGSSFGGGGGGGSGTVTSVGLNLPSSIFTVSGSPITINGTLTGTLKTHTANTVWAGPTSGAAALPAFRGLVAADIPLISLTAGVSGVLPIANGGTNSSTALSNNRIIQSSGSKIVEAAAITASKLLVSDANGIPVASTLSGIAHLSSGTLTASAVSLTADVSGILPVANGGTGQNNILQVNARFVDFLDGDDSTGDGSNLRPWKTLQFAYDSITTASINRPFTIYLSGGNNSTDSSPITGKPNISIIAPYFIQIPALTISGSITNDGMTFQNLIFLGAFTWIRNDASSFGPQFNSCEFFSGPVVKQNGSGTAGITMYDCVTVNMDLLVPRTGSFFNNHQFLGTTTFGDADFNSYYECLGGYSSSAMTISGGAELYLNGIQTDVAFGATLTGVTTANGTPLIQTDSSSVPSAIAGAFTLSLISNSQYESYSAGAPGDWAVSPPTDVKTAIDRMASLLKTLNLGTPIP